MARRTRPREITSIWSIIGECIGKMRSTKMIKEEKADILDFDQLPKSKQNEIEHIIEQKIRQRQEKELKILLKEVTDEIERSKKKN